MGGDHHAHHDSPFPYPAEEYLRPDPLTHRIGHDHSPKHGWENNRLARIAWRTPFSFRQVYFGGLGAAWAVAFLFRFPIAGYFDDLRYAWAGEADRRISRADVGHHVALHNMLNQERRSIARVTGTNTSAYGHNVAHFSQRGSINPDQLLSVRDPEIARALTRADVQAELAQLHQRLEQGKAAATDKKAFLDRFRW
eukprot:TRINITY_DN4518_c0_g1_i1.p1 TRINITY_DN4518_c0_g1~~TRINITY_DN4518_c0_g1_i1.p1  ORF type:complete len:196 (-),score=32.53 TRINITY_DN4518_c0_g1_i1:96-683(-)